MDKDAKVILESLIPTANVIFEDGEDRASTLVERNGTLYKIKVEKMLPEFQRIYGDMKAAMR